MRYIDLNPVRPHMTDDPTAFLRSSCVSLCGRRDDPLLTPHPVQHAPGTEGYRRWIAEAISDEDLAAMRLTLQQQRVDGRDDFGAWSRPRPSVCWRQPGASAFQGSGQPG